MIVIDGSKTVKAEGYRVSQKGESLTITLASSFQPNGMSWRGGDEIREMYAEDVVIDGEAYDVVLIMRRKMAGSVSRGPKHTG
ncbi:MAG TPA: hypothetical protein VGJ92_02485 [Methanocella sp.]|jgi:hypothetical protein